MPTVELNPVQLSPGEGYPDLDELLRQLPSPEAGFKIGVFQYKLIPPLWKLFRGVLDDDGEIMSGVKVREIAYSVAFDVVIKKSVENGATVSTSNLIALAGGKEEPRSAPKGDASPLSAGPLESDPCPPPN